MRTFLTAFALLFAVNCPAAAQGRTEDVRVRPPESWPKREVYGLDIKLGGSYMRGNVENRGISGGLDFNTTFSERHQLFVQASKDYAEYGDSVAVDKDKGSFMYAYKLRERVNIFFTSTHAHNKALTLKYRTANGAGVCYHNFWPGVLEPVLVSFAVTPEYETFKDGTKNSRVRGDLRFNFKYEATKHLSVGADLIYMPGFSDLSDYRMFGEAYFQFKITDRNLDFRVNLTDEYESKPRPGVKCNDFIAGYALVLKLGR
ncbi:MAG: hypothetical protein A3J79_06580 [Elusimicrobia bacterium RIFOXYB2_FULL_62_6]|nr:MAG: hypothetical protein A3J79_06580 [Elusimicrobia bacterium RIFOXYB2_FULL_62_6]